MNIYLQIKIFVYIFKFFPRILTHLDNGSIVQHAILISSFLRKQSRAKWNPLEALRIEKNLQKFSHTTHNKTILNNDIAPPNFSL